MKKTGAPVTGRPFYCTAWQSKHIVRLVTVLTANDCCPPKTPYEHFKCWPFKIHIRTKTTRKGALSLRGILCGMIFSEIYLLIYKQVDGAIIMQPVSPPQAFFATKCQHHLKPSIGRQSFQGNGESIRRLNNLPPTSPFHTFLCKDPLTP